MADIRLIDANALKKEMVEVEIVTQPYSHYTSERVVFDYDIDDAPTIDAVPVVHARWACDEDFNTVCTGCGKRIPTFRCYNEETDEEWDEPIDKTPFCPNCGAKMDGGSE